MAPTTRISSTRMDRSTRLDRRGHASLGAHANGPTEQYQVGCDSEDHQRYHGRWHLQLEYLQRGWIGQPGWTGVETPSSARMLKEPNQHVGHDELERGPSRVQRLQRKRGRSSEARNAQVRSDGSGRTDEPLSPLEPPWTIVSDSPATTPRGLPGGPGFPSPPSMTWTPSSICEMPRTSHRFTRVQPIGGPHGLVRARAGTGSIRQQECNPTLRPTAHVIRAKVPARQATADLLWVAFPVTLEWSRGASTGPVEHPQFAVWREKKEKSEK